MCIVTLKLLTRTAMKLYLPLMLMVFLELSRASTTCMTNPFGEDLDLWTFLEYSNKTSQLFINFTSFNPGLLECMAQTHLTYKFELITDDNKIQANKERSCMRLSEQMEIGHPPILYRSNVTHASFQYVEGQYFLRIKECFGSNCNSEECHSTDRCWCSKTRQFGPRNKLPILNNCSEKNSTFEAIIRPGHEEKVQCKPSGQSACNFSFVAIVPMCIKIQDYSRAKLRLLKRPLNGTDGKQITCSDMESDMVPVTQCNTTWCRDKNPRSHHGLIQYNMEVPPNALYILVIQLLSPRCYQRNNENCCFVLDPVPCYPHASPCYTHLKHLWKKPVIVGGVCGLVVGIALVIAVLLWCKKTEKPQYLRVQRVLPNEIHPQNISKLQEIVLIHFPDKEIFRELNNKFRDWLLSLSTVKEVIDVNNDRYSEGDDGIVRNPEGWVANTLGDADKRVILVTSQLAYQCLTHLRKGEPPPKFPTPNPLDDLLVHMLRFLDSEMFKGNYSRLSCVRYSQVSICHDLFGAKAVNIVPGTEYLLPEHLDELEGWINPQEMKTEQNLKKQHFLLVIEAYQQSELRQTCGVYTKI